MVILGSSRTPVKGSVHGFSGTLEQFILDAAKVDNCF